MSQQAAKRRRSQASNNFGHLCAQQRPDYKKAHRGDIHAAIAAERAKAARMAAAASKKKK